MITLRELLESMARPGDDLPDKWSKWDNILAPNYNRIRLRFAAEAETSVITYVNHPILIPWYDCKVCGIEPSDAAVINVWLAYEEYMPGLIKRCEHGVD